MRRLGFICVVLAILSGCGLATGPTNEIPDQQERDRKAEGSIFGEDGITFGGDKGNSSDGGSLGVNGFLWRASLDTISFFPLSQAGAVLALFGFALLGGVVLLATSMLALPALLLEEKGASHALTRSWQLGTQGLGSLAGLAGSFLLVQSLIATPFAALGLPLIGNLAGVAFGLFLPALMVAAYHGLAAEEAHVLGRG